MAAKDYLQPHLFDPGPEQEPHPGDMSIDDWVQRPDVVFHGTFRNDFKFAPTIHAGTKTAAEERVAFVGGILRSSHNYRKKYYDPSSDLKWDDGEDTGPQEHEGRVYAVRLTKPAHTVKGTSPSMSDSRTTSSDQNANAADVFNWLDRGHERWDIPESVKQSAEGVSPRISHDDRLVIGNMTRQGVSGARALRRGQPIEYVNDGEDAGSKSVVAPTSALRTWENDVKNSPNRSQMAKDYAAQRQEQGVSGSVLFRDLNSKSAPPEQLSLFGHPDYNLNNYRSVMSIQFQTPD